MNALHNELKFTKSYLIWSFFIHDIKRFSHLSFCQFLRDAFANVFVVFIVEVPPFFSVVGLKNLLVIIVILL
jgi:hypothetical protein